MDLTKIIDSATFDNDGKACFDRIIPALTNLPREIGTNRRHNETLSRRPR
jgi:hypothetical protein